MDSGYTQVAARDLWAEARKQTLTVQQVAGNTSTLRLTWTLPPLPWKAYDGCIILLSDVQFTGENVPEDGKRYTASSNYAAPADKIGNASVVATYYGYFGDDTTTVSVDITNTDPTKIYYAALYAATNVLAYYPIGIHSYPVGSGLGQVDSNVYDRAADFYAGSIAHSVEPPDNPSAGQCYFDPVANKVLVWNSDLQSWIEAPNQTTVTGERFPVEPNQVYVNSTTSSVRLFSGGMWIDGNATNTRVKYGTGWVPLGAVTVTSTLPDAPNSGDIAIIMPSAPVGLNAASTGAKIFTMGQWLPLSAGLLQIETAPSTWSNVVFGDKLITDQDPIVPDVGFFFYSTASKNLFSWSGTEWVRADTADEGTTTADKFGIGDDGSWDDKIDLIRVLKTQMGWPTICIELSEEAFHVAIEDALQTFRQRADNAYKHRFIPFVLKRGQQLYYLNDPRLKTDRIVNVMKIHRVNALGAAQVGDPVWGQLFLPQGMANAPSFDLTALHLFSQMGETYEKLFAGNLMFTWDEASRQLMIHRNLARDEQVVMECVIERSKQELISDRWCQQWIQGFALAQLKQTLGYIRTKYGSVAGPNGGLTLNGDALLAEAQSDFQELNRQINDYEVGNGGINFGNTAFYIG